MDWKIIKLIAVLIFAAVPLYGQSPPLPASPLVPTPEQQTNFNSAQKRVTDAAVALELAKKEMELALALRGQVLLDMMAEMSLPPSKYQPQIDKDGKLVFILKEPNK